MADRTGGWDVRHFLVHNVSVGHALAVAAAVWPGFVERDGCVFVDFLFSEESYGRWRDSLGDDRRALETVMNHLHLWDVFAPSSDADRAALEVLAPRIAGAWRQAAGDRFPDRTIEVDVTGEPEDYDPTLVLYSTGAGDLAVAP